MYELRKINICFVIDSLGIGGAGLLTLGVINHLDPDIYKVRLISLTRPRENDITLESKIPSHVDVVILQKSDYGYYGRLLKLRNLFKGFNIVHSCLEVSNLYCGLVKAFFRPKSKFVSTIHGVDGVFINDPLVREDLKKNFARKYFFLNKYLLSLCLRFFERIIAVSDHTKRHLIKQRKLDAKKIVTIYHGIDFNDYYRTEDDKIFLKNSYNFAPNEFIIGYVGRLTYGKGLEKLVKVVNNLCRSYKNIKLLMVGGGDLETSLRNYINSNNIAKSCFVTGYVKNVADYYQLLDLFVLPSSSEGIPISLLEAMFLKKITLCSNVGGISEVVKDGKNGFLFEVSNLVEFEKKIIYIKNNMVSLEAIKENANLTIKNRFDLKTNADLISKEFLKLLWQ